MADVFVSYKAEDRARVRPLVDTLQADGLDVWWDAHISVREEWRETIAANLEKARCVIVVWSRRSVGPGGQFVRDEATRAVKRATYLPVTIDKIEPPLGFGETQCLPLCGWKGDRDDPRYRTLLEAARQVMSGAKVQRQGAAGTSPGSAGLDRRAVIAGGLVAVVAAGGAGWYFLRAGRADARSVVVMPFANLSGDPAQAYFSDGLAEELRSALARISGLKVIGRTSSEAVRNDDAETVAKKLGVGSVLTGSVRRSSSMIRVSAQLVNGADGVEKWSQTFDRTNGDLLQIQTDIAEAVVEQLRSQLDEAEKAALKLGGTKNPAAQDLLLKANTIVELTKPALESQIALFDAAISLDPNYAAAYAGKSLAQTRLAIYQSNSTDELNRYLVQSAASARKAISIAPNFADGHLALGFNRNSAVDYPSAWAEYQRALQFPGLSPFTRLGIASFVARMGNFARAQAILQSAADSDPLNPRLFATQADLNLVARRYQPAIAAYRKFLALNPDATGPRSGLAMSLLLSGKDLEAIHEAEKLPPNFPTSFVVQAVVANRSKDRARAAAIVNDMRKANGKGGSYQYAEILADMGNQDEAIAELQQALKVRDPGLLLLATDPLLDPLRDDPRFRGIVSQLNIPSI